MQYLRAEIQSMAQEDLLAMVDRRRLGEIKASDPHPEIRAYAIGHEGEANFNMVNDGVGAQLFKFARTAVRWIYDALNIGTKAFNRHGSNNSHAGREPIGEVVGKDIRDIDGRTTAIAAFYVYPEHKDVSLDVASIETDVEYWIDDGGLSIPIGVRPITGIALGNGATDTPGFPGAKLLSAVAAMRQDGGIQAMNLKELKQAIREAGYKPTQVFDMGDIMDDSDVQSRVKEEKTDLYNMNKRLEKERDDVRDEVAQKDKEWQDKLKTYKSESLKVKAGPMLDKEAKKRNLTEQQVKFATSHLERFSPEADSDDGLLLDVQKFLDSELEEYNNVRGIFGIDEVDEPKSGPSGGSTGPSDGSGTPDPLDDDEYNVLPDDNENPFLPWSPASTKEQE